MITREELYQMMWSRPQREIARQLGISDVYLGRVCKALDVPRPRQGWWITKSVKRAPPPPLPAAQPGHPSSWSKGGGENGPIKLFYVSPPARSKACGMHPLAVYAIKFFGGPSPESDEAIVTTRAHMAADLTICRLAVDAAIHAFNILSMALEERGHAVSIERWQSYIRPSIDFRDPSSAQLEDMAVPRWTPRWPTIAKIGSIPLGLAIVEIREKKLMQYSGEGRYIPVATKRRAPKPSAGITWREGRWMPSGRLKLVAYSPSPRFPWKAEWTLADPEDVAATSALVKRLEDAAARLEVRRNEQRIEVAGPPRLRDGEFP